MPGFDGSGPLGTGPIGRGMGPCGGGYAYRGRGRGFARGFGFGMGWGVNAMLLTEEEEKQALEQQKNWLETQLGAVSERLQGFDKTKK